MQLEAGIDTSDRKMIPNFNKAAGFDCMVNVGAPDAKSLTLFLLSPIGAESDKLGETEASSVRSVCEPSVLSRQGHRWLK